MMAKKNILLIGSGAVGTIAALNLEAGGKATVTAVLRSNYTVVKEKGFTIRSCDHGSKLNWRPSKIVEVIPDATLIEKPFDYIVIATKNVQDYGTSIITKTSRAVTPGFTTIVLIQNGLNIERQWFEMFPQNCVLSGISMIGSQEAGPGIIHHTASDILSIGAFRNVNLDIEMENKFAEEFVSVYAASGKTNCTLTLDVRMDRWKKLVYNASMNPLCAITGLDSGSLQLAGDAVSTLIEPAMQEIVAAATASGCLLPENIIQAMIVGDPIKMHFVPSMLQDVRKMNLIEHENILGEALREGMSLGVSMPTIAVLYNLCKVIQWRIQAEQTHKLSIESLHKDGDSF